MLLQLGFCTTDWVPQCIVVSITMVEDTDGVMFAILLTIFSYNFEATRILALHVNSDWHPRNEEMSINLLQIICYKTL